MISNRKGDKTTPKDRAAELLADYLEGFQGWYQPDSDMTERESSLVLDQALKYQKRFYKTLRTEPAVQGTETDVASEEVATEDAA